MFYLDYIVEERKKNSNITCFSPGLDTCSSPIPAIEHEFTPPRATPSTYECSFNSSASNVSTSDSSCQTPLHLSQKTPRKLQLIEKLKKSQRENKELRKQYECVKTELDRHDSMESMFKLCKKYLPPSLVLIIKTHIDRQNKKEKGCRYNNEFKQLALTIYFLSPKVYRFIRSTLALPSPTTLKRVTKRYEIFPGLNDFIFDFLAFKTSNFTSESLECILCADEMSLKSNLYYNVYKDEIIGFNETNNRKTYDPAKFTLVLMLRGININWKQPIAYYFISSSCSGFELQDIILKTIYQLQKIKFIIKAFVTDMGSNFIGLKNNFNVSPERPYFEVNNQKIIFLFDPPHLLKATRNMFFLHNFKYGGNFIEKNHVITFYNEDSKNNLRAAPKLTHSHIFPGPFEKMRVYLAAQLFSTSVAAGMKTFLQCNILNDDSIATIKFIEDMDKLFDIFNSSKRPAKKSYNRPFKGTDVQYSHLKYMESFFKELQVFNKKSNLDVTKRMKFINGWLISISGLFRLWDSLKSNHNDNNNYVLYTNRINQDCLENLFGSFRQHYNGNNINPSPIQLIWSFKRMFNLDYFSHSDNANCIDDLDLILKNIKCNPVNDDEDSMFKNIFSDKPLFKFKNLIKIDSVDYRHLPLPEQNTFIYVCGYLMKKCIDRHSCDICINYAKSQKRIDDSFILCYFKAYENKESSTFGNLMMPQDTFYNFIHQLELIFIQRFPLVSIEKEVGNKLILHMSTVIYNHPCPLFDKEYLIKFFVRFRIYAAIKFLNRTLVSEKIKKNRKLVILEHL